MFEISASATSATIVIAGDLDVAERHQFPDMVARVVALRRQLLVIDMCGVTFMDSAGAAFLIALADAGRRRGAATVLRGIDPRELFVLEVCGAVDLFRIDTEHQCEDTPPRVRALPPEPPPA